MNTETEVRLDSRTLRTIGQDLERIPMSDFDLELNGTKCVVRGTPSLPRDPAEVSSGGLKGWWKRNKENGPEPHRGSSTPVERVYRPEDIQRLDAEGQAKRVTARGSADLYSTSQMLRVAGAYLEDRRCRLISLFKKGAALRFDYLDSSGNRQSEKRVYSELYDFGFRLCRQRKSPSPANG